MIKTWPHLLEAPSLVGRKGTHTVTITQRRVIVESLESKVGEGALRREKSFSARGDMMILVLLIIVIVIIMTVQ